MKNKTYTEDKTSNKGDVNHIISRYMYEVGIEGAKFLEQGLTTKVIKPSWCPKFLYSFIIKHFIKLEIKDER